jgi:hypothetical protein
LRALLVRQELQQRIGSTEMRSIETRTGEITVVERRAPEFRTTKVGTFERTPRESRRAKIGTAQISVGKITADKIVPTQPGLVKVGVVEINALEQ